MTKPKRPRDPNQLGKSIIDIATGNAGSDLEAAEKGARAVARGKPGGTKGGPARAAALTAAQRVEIAKIAAQAHCKHEPTFEAIEWKIGGGAYVKVTFPNQAPVNVEGFKNKNEALIWIRQEAKGWLRERTKLSASAQISRR